MPAAEQPGQQAEPLQQALASSADGDGQRQMVEMPTSSSDGGPSQKGRQLQQPVKRTISETPSHTGTLMGAREIASNEGLESGRLAISLDGSIMASTFRSGSWRFLDTVRMWNLPDKACCWETQYSGSFVQNSRLAQPIVTDVSLTQNGSSIMTSSRHFESQGESGLIRVWSTATGSQRVSLSSAHPVSRVAPVGADAAHIASLAYGSGRAPHASLWNLDTAQLIDSFDFADAKDSSVQGTSLAALSGGSTCLVGYEKGFSLWDLRAHQKADLLGGKGRVGTATEPDSVRDVAAKPDGSLCVTAMQSGAIMVWDLRAPQSCVATLKVHEKAATSVSFAPDSRHFISGSADQTVRVLDLDGGQCKLTMRGHAAGVTSVVAFPDGMNCASASLDGTIRLWRYAD
ncbi:quinon protein alcohol dehydrogenase-like superfamily [Dunaliella salina]|uniref:Quinon protein alcohol dehydrogenase-like superfamily n=1 Tax=Dunaliella salina TaxID=3046 RepID=A0ABQ7G4H5_DUNSA|nr:quinon protein alcohol dehydrogenase-like superfamily [Dunaliella salina]|eukprot:KAF5829472.1 quinon protein alcohol dehydrogenase-like superfamily [Dunaliella salina]